MSVEQRPRSGLHRRFGLIVGVGLGTGMVAGRGAEKLLAPGLGEWGSYGAGRLAGAMVAAVVGLLVSYVLGRRGAGD